MAPQARKTPPPKVKTLDWSHNRDMCIRVLEKKTGKGLINWNARIKKQKFADASSLKDWLREEGVTGYGRQLLIEGTKPNGRLQPSSIHETMKLQISFIKP